MFVYIVLKLLLSLASRVDLNKLFNELMRDFIIESAMITNTPKKNKDNVFHAICVKGALFYLHLKAFYYIFLISSLPLLKVIVFLYELSFFYFCFAEIKVW